ncbi:autotransporter assembly complex protein TamB [Biostraticola tofi]|uniref:Autotransporter secretion inner membrane protein TamB n=1 Tax=Biostraticola tofi TaxID=466109 RepID=A0A4R3Z0A5_9GAMM|nr:translocation/assembly module TamB domain-containing protein [Biostraticola tofi]TCV99020.1 autotransporter secretion inner membrane protein TamB [Biostraticola tofi]
MSLIKKISLGIFIFIILLLATVAYLLGTTSGLHLILNGASRWVPGLDIASVSGGWRDLSLNGVSWQMPGVTVRAGQFHLSVNTACLRQRQLCLDDLSLSEVAVSIRTAEMTPTPEQEPAVEQPASSISTPYPVILKRLAINNVSVQVDGTAVSLNQFTSGITFSDNNLVVSPTHIEGLLVKLPKAAEIITDQAIDAVIQTEQEKKEAATRADAEKAALRQAPPLGETLAALFAKPLLPSIPNIQLPLNITLEDLRAENLRLTGDVDILVTSLALRMAMQDQHLSLTKLDIDSPQGLLNASGEASLRDNWPVNLTVNSKVNVAPLKGERVKLTVNGELRQELKGNINLSGPLGAGLSLKTRLAETGLPLDLRIVSDNLQWPLTGTPHYQARNVSMHLAGRATDYRLAVGAALSGEGMPPATLAIQGNGTPSQFTLSRLRVDALQGHTDLTAVIDWSKAISWRSELTLTGINTARQWPDWPARVAGKMTTKGSLYGGSWQLRVPELKLDGNIKQNKLSAKGSLSGNAANQWNIPGIQLALGRNSLDIKGQLDEKLALDATIDAPRLDGALPGLGGTAKGKINVRGSLMAPQLLADLTASGLRFQALSVRQVNLKGDLSSSDQIKGNLTLRVSQLQQDSFKISTLLLTAKGNEKQHQLRVSLTGDPVAGQLSLDGGFDRQQQRWQGRLSQTRFETPVGEWRLSRDMTLDYLNAGQKITVGPHCWQNPNANLCVPTNIVASPQGGQGSLLLNRFDLAMIKPFLTDDTQLAGVFSGRADVSWKQGDSLPQAKVSLVGKGVNIRQNVDSRSLPVAFDTLNVNAALDKGNANLDWLVKIAGNGQTDGQLRIADPQGRRNLTGNLNIRDISLAIINPILSRGESANGQLNANLRIGGNSRQPLIFGQLGLEKVIIKGNWMPFAMQSSRLALDFSGTRSVLQGLVQTTRGQINLAGNADWSQIDAWRARIAAKGDKVRITVPPMVRLDVSPDVVFDASPTQFALNGTVDIPWARIVVQELPESAVGVSSDQVLLDEQLKPIAPARAPAVPINSNLTIHVGKDVRLDAFGLKARLQGDLKMVQDHRGLGLNGQIDIPSGRFHAYGQDLIVNKGQLLFSGPPDQPLLNIEAIRNPDSTEDGVTAGVRVTGLADQPKLDVFSDPVKSQQEALSYLLRGQGLDASGGDSNMMTSMLVGMGVAQSGQLVGKIGEAFGVSHLALDTQGVGDSSQVVVSGYVAPGLQVKYGVGIFDSLATLTLRYRLMPKLYLEAVSGLDQALDLLYQFEF